MWKHSVLPHDTLCHPFSVSERHRPLERKGLSVGAMAELSVEPGKASGSFSRSDDQWPSTTLSIGLTVVRIDPGIYFLKPWEFSWSFHYLMYRKAGPPATTAGARLHRALQEAGRGGWACELWLPAGGNLPCCAQGLLNDSFKSETNTKQTGNVFT